MKVLIAADCPNCTTSYGNIAYFLGKYLVRRGVEVIYGGFQHIGAPTYINVDGRYLPVFSYYGGQQSYLERILEDESPDFIIHIRDLTVFVPRLFPSSYSIKPVAQRYGAKVVLWVPVMHDSMPSDMVQACNNEGDIVLTPTEWSMSTLVFSGVPSNKIYVIPWGVDPEVYYPRKRDRSLLGASDDSFLIGMVGVHDQARKNIPAVMHAVSQLLKEVDNVEVYIHSSSGAFLLEHYVEMLGLRRRVIVPRIYLKEWGLTHEEMAVLYSSLDVYCSASTAEGANMPCIEAAACGTPVVCSDMPNHRELLNGCALYAKSYHLIPDTYSFTYATDVDDLANKLKQVYNMTEEERSEFKRGAETLRERLSWRSIVNRLLAVLKGYEDSGS